MIDYEHAEHFGLSEGIVDEIYFAMETDDLQLMKSITENVSALEYLNTEFEHVINNGSVNIFTHYMDCDNGGDDIEESIFTDHDSIIWDTLFENLVKCDTDKLENYKAIFKGLESCLFLEDFWHIEYYLENTGLVKFNDLIDTLESIIDDILANE